MQRRRMAQRKDCGPADLAARSRTRCPVGSDDRRCAPVCRDHSSGSGGCGRIERPRIVHRLADRYGHRKGAGRGYGSTTRIRAGTGSMGAPCTSAGGAGRLHCRRVRRPTERGVCSSFPGHSRQHARHAARDHGYPGRGSRRMAEQYSNGASVYRGGWAGEVVCAVGAAIRIERACNGNARPGRRAHCPSRRSRGAPRRCETGTGRSRGHRFLRTALSEGIRCRSPSKNSIPEVGHLI